MNYREQDFLKGLTALTQKYGIAVWGCGCCGSPTLVDLREEGESTIGHYELGSPKSASDLEWVTKSDI